MHRLLPLIALFAVAADRAPARAARVVLADDADAHWVDFTLTPGNQISFAMALDGRAVTAVLDTGVSDTVLARGSAAVVPARLRPHGRATTIGAAGIGRGSGRGSGVAVAWMPVATLTLGGLRRTGGGVVVAPLPATATGGGATIDLLVGADLLRGQAVEIDYAAHRFRILPSGRLPFTGTTVTLTVSPRRRIYESAVAIGGRTVRPVVVDTGDGTSVTLARDQWAAVRPPGVRTTTAIGFGLGGAVVEELAVVPAVALGTLTTREVEVRVEPADGFSATIGVGGRIGSGLLQRFRVLLDPAAGRMVLAPRADPLPPPLRSTTGLLIGIEPDRLRVLHVMRGSPAAAAGWRADDLICAIDGRPVAPDYATSGAARWSIAPAGTTVRLRDCAGRDRALVAQDFY